MKLYAIPRKLAENTVFDDKTAVISITAPGYPGANIKGTKNVLRLSFHDVWPMNLPKQHVKKIYGDIKLFSEKEAENIFRFVLKHRELDKIVVHCEQGYSRSSAVAAALCEFFKDCEFQEFFDEKHYRPNMLVYSVLYNFINRKKLR